jgi:23S rRNA (cytosine1962-C5)-methyltransferase
MFPPDQYELLDFGDGRKLERFGRILLDRPSPAAEDFERQAIALWNDADARFDREQANWIGNRPLEPWTIRHDELTFELRATDFGHVGLFAEQADNWTWIAEQAKRAARPLKVLNLFAYTGGSTLAAAAAGAAVVHIDAASNVVQWARRNAELSLLAQQPIRWIAEDAAKFVERAVRRGNQYDAVILDPPTYGHGPSGQPWKLETDLAPLLAGLAALTKGQRAFILLTCHTPGYEAKTLSALLRSAMGPGNVAAGELYLATGAGRKLPSGHYARWTA